MLCDLSCWCRGVAGVVINSACVRASAVGREEDDDDGIGGRGSSWFLEVETGGADRGRDTRAHGLAGTSSASPLA
jgi:hypothetical protein